MWRAAETTDEAAITALGLALHAEDPSPTPATAASFGRTLAAFRAAPWRGRALVLHLLHLERVAGYALLISYWSNELGGEVCAIDELYVAPAARGQGWGSHLIEALAAGSDLGFGDSVALAIGVSPDNTRARSLYERLGFRGKNISLARPCTGTRALLLRRT